MLSTIMQTRKLGLRDQVDQERATALKKSLGIAFVTLIRLEAAQKVYIVTWRNDGAHGVC